MVRVLLPTAAFLAPLVAILAVVLERTALPAILPVEVTGILSALAALGLGWLWLRRRKRPPALRLAAFAAGIALAGTMGWLGWQRFGGFETEEVSFAGQDARLAGTIYWPSDRPAAPAAVIVHGSGEATRGEYAYYARQLAKRGIATLVYDKRGSGHSTGNLYEDGYAAYASDAGAAFDLLSARADEVGFIGYSEGEWTVPLAARGRDSAFVAIVGPSGLSPAEQVWEEVELRLARAGFDAREISEARGLHRAISAYERSGEGFAELKTALAAASGKEWFAVAEDFPRPEELGAPEEYGWWRAVMDTDPAALWHTVDAPVLLLKGGADDRSSAMRARRRFSELLPGADFRIFGTADHMLLHRSAPVPSFADGYFDQLAEWIELKAIGEEVSETSTLG